MVVGGSGWARRGSRGEAAACLPCLPVPQEEKDAEQYDHGGAREDDVHVADVETLHVDGILVAS